jgi:hypothetical protein
MTMLNVSNPFSLRQARQAVEPEQPSSGWAVRGRLPHRGEMQRRLAKCETALVMTALLEGADSNSWEAGCTSSRLRQEFWPEGAGDVVVQVREGATLRQVVSEVAMLTAQLVGNWPAYIGPRSDEEDEKVERAKEEGDPLEGPNGWYPRRRR